MRYCIREEDQVHIGFICHEICNNLDQFCVVFCLLIESIFLLHAFSQEIAEEDRRFEEIFLGQVRFQRDHYLFTELFSQEKPIFFVDQSIFGHSLELVHPKLYQHIRRTQSSLLHQHQTLKDPRNIS